jgi:hypothetical protein
MIFRLKAEATSDPMLDFGIGSAGPYVRSETVGSVLARLVRRR